MIFRDWVKKGSCLVFASVSVCAYGVNNLLSHSPIVDKALKEARKTTLQTSNFNNIGGIENEIILKILKILIGFEDLPNKYIEYFTHTKREGIFTNLVTKVHEKQRNVGENWIVVSRFLKLLRVTLLLGTRNQDLLDIVHYMSIPANVGITPDKKFECDTLDEMRELTEKLKGTWPNMKWKTSYEKLDDSLEEFLKIAAVEATFLQTSKTSDLSSVKTRSTGTTHRATQATSRTNVR
ncbi:MAG: hypothetical protein LBQ08_04505 [Holosporaceae bacterium]|jgi:hypothetical protein|nr:hypothetical protein [Holosporaceae bacterium]